MSNNSELLQTIQDVETKLEPHFTPEEFKIIQQAIEEIKATLKQKLSENQNTEPNT